VFSRYLKRYKGEHASWVPIRDYVYNVYLSLPSAGYHIFGVKRVFQQQTANLTVPTVVVYSHGASCHCRGVKMYLICSTLFPGPHAHI
jgi:hypothetical protein